MTKSAIQIRIPKKLEENIEGLVKKGLYKNRSEVVIDAVRHFLGSGKKSGTALVIEQQLIGKRGEPRYSKNEIDELWEKIRKGEAWKKRFGESPNEVMATLRERR